MGYYPCNPATINFVCASLRVADPTRTYLLDPCCGEGRALGQLGDNLGVSHEHRYGVELDAGRAATAAEHGNILQSSFFGARIVPVNSFSLVWLNPPYTDEIKQPESYGTRQLEIAFLSHAIRYVTPNGVVIMHCPLDRITPTMMSEFYSVCHDPVIVELPDKCRPYREALLVGVKRPKAERSAYVRDLRRVGSMPALVVPTGELIKKFIKVEPTDDELVASIDSAHYMKVFRQKQVKPKLRPVMPLGAGHLGLTLASGLLDGMLEPEGWEKHVIRGVAWKESELAKSDKEVDAESGKVTTTEVYRENIRLKMRVLTLNGEIHEIR